jgi:cell division septation protein DedD
VEPKKPAAKEKPVAPTPAPESDNDSVKVQLGAYRSEKEAQDAWNAMQKKHADLLESEQPNVVKANLGAKGIYYRLRIGGFTDAVDAKAFCGKLTAAGQACIIPTTK